MYSNSCLGNYLITLLCKSEVKYFRSNIPIQGGVYIHVIVISVWSRPVESKGTYLIKEFKEKLGVCGYYGLSRL